MKKLIEAGANVNYADRTGNTLLHLVCELLTFHSFTFMTHSLVPSLLRPFVHAFVGSFVPFIFIQLGQAAMFNRLDMAELLIKRGANLNKENPSNETPLDVAPPSLAAKMKAIQV